jgi:hypothetical protein
MFEHSNLGQKTPLLNELPNKPKILQQFGGYVHKKAPENWGPSLNIKHK